jgi:hypothetical protein
MKHTSNHVIEQLLICMSTLQLSLPAMMMSIDEARTDELVGTIDDLDILRGFNILRNRHDLAALNQKAGSSWGDVVVIVMKEERAILENDAFRNDV